MGKPKTEVKEKEYYRDIHFLYEIINSFHDVEELKCFIKDILTRSELRMMKRRWHIANLLYKGFDIRTISQKAKASTSTVIRVKKTLEEGYGGLRIAIARTEEKVKKERRSSVKVQRGSSKYVKAWFQ